MDEYDIRKAFEEMELELIASMKRNLARHRKWETKEGMNWTMWQAEQLKTLENFRKSNQKLFDKKFSKLNKEIESFLKEQYETAGLDQEKAILRELAKGKSIPDIGEGLEGAFFSLNEDKMNALIKAVTDDMKTAETAMLRMVNDQYRSTIYNAQVMSNSGAFTLQQSIDKATKDFLKAGINCIQYKGGRRVNIASYAEMAIRTANKRAILISEGDARNAYDVHTVRISKYGGCSETCLPWQGRIYVDDVYSGGTKEEAQEKKLPLLSEAIEGGLFHPNCRHRATTYFYDLKKSLGKIQEDDVENPLDEQVHRKNQLHIQQQKRIETGALDQKNVVDAKDRREQWIDKDVRLFFNEDLLSDFKKMKKQDALPKAFQFTEEKENNLLAVYQKIDKRFLSDGNEHLAMCRADTGELIEITTSNEKNHVVPNKMMLKLLDESNPNTFTLIHNHPKRTPISIGDLITTIQNPSIKETIVINDLGEIYFFSVGNGARINIENKENIAEFVKKYYSYVKLFNGDKEEAIKRLCVEGGWEYGKRTSG